MIGNARRYFSLLALLAALSLASFGCGGDDEDTDTAAQTDTAPAETRSEETAAETDTEAETETEPAETETTPAEAETEAEPAPEEEPGGAGDEEPARSLAMFTGRGGQITPRTIRVPAFLSIRVELRSADGRDYGLRIAGETLNVTGVLGSVSTTFDGLRPNQVLVGTPIGPGNRVRIEATAEPGP
jgi:hypothetical protein